MYALNRFLFATLIVTTWFTVTGCGNWATKDPDFDNPISLDQDSEPALKEKARLKGHWNVVSDSMDPDTRETYEFQGDRATVFLVSAKRTNEYRFAIDPTKTPPRIDMFSILDDGSEFKIPRRGIYSLDDGILTISVGGWGPSSGHGDPFRRADTIDPAADDPKRAKWRILELRREE